MSSIQEVAKKAGVSPTTVSRTFRSPGMINAQTHQRVLEAARQLEYKPKGRGLGKAKAAAAVRDTIGFQFFADRPEDTLQSNTFYAPMLVGAQAEASELGLNLLVHTANRHNLSKDLPKMVLDRVIGGMLLVGAGADDRTLATFSPYVPRIVLLDQRDEQGRFECVVSDGLDGAHQATQYLLSLGHRRIGFFLAETHTRTFQDRLRGYLAAIFEAGIAPDHDLVIGGDPQDSDEIREGRLAKLFASEKRPTALITANDDYALFTMRAFRKLGIRIPEDVSLIGFDDIPYTTHTDPPLTTVRVDKELLGRLGVRRLHAQMQAAERPAAEPRGRYEVPVSLVVRQSCRVI